MHCGKHSKHFPTHQMRIRPLRHITDDMKISILPTAPIGLMQKKKKKSGYFYWGTQQVHGLYLTKKKKKNKQTKKNKTCELGFLETIKLLSELFSSKTSQFHKRWKCPKLAKRDSDDYLGFASVVNKNCDDFKQDELSADNFKFLIFAQGLVSAKDAEIRRRVLSKFENEPYLTLQKLAEDSEC